MTILAWLTGASIVLHNATVFYFQQKYTGESSFTRAWFRYMRSNLLAEGRGTFLVPTITFVLTMGLCLTLVVSMLVSSSR